MRFAFIESWRQGPDRLRLERDEFAGALGDIGTSLPLLVGVTLAAKLNAASVLVVFGVMQIFTALRYRLPMPVQPLKAMAALVIAQGITGNVLHGAGLAIGLVMLVLTFTGGIDAIGRFVPLTVMRGLQLGLGLTLAPLFGGVPVCHGAGGMAGHCAFGARTGSSVRLYGAGLLVAGLCFGPMFNSLISAFPLPVLGVMLLFESISLLLLTRGVFDRKREFFIAFITGLAACYLPDGFAVALVLGTTLDKVSARWSIAFLSPEPAKSA